MLVMHRDVLISMFEEMVVRKDAGAIEKFYDPGFVMESNGVTQDYAAFRTSHEGVYNTGISYAVEYDNDAWLEQGDRIAARMWITTTRPGEAPTRIEVVLIAAMRDGRIHRVWELIWPTWSDLPAFENYE